MLFSCKLFMVGSTTSLLQKYLLTSSSLEASSQPYNKNFFILKGLASVPIMQDSGSYSYKYTRSIPLLIFAACQLGSRPIQFQASENMTIDFYT